MRIDTNLISFHPERGSKGVRATYPTEMQKKGLCELCSPDTLIAPCPLYFSGNDSIKRYLRMAECGRKGRCGTLEAAGKHQGNRNSLEITGAPHLREVGLFVVFDKTPDVKRGVKMGTYCSCNSQAY